MLINLNAIQAKELLNILNTEDAFGALPKCLGKTLMEIEGGLENYENRSQIARLL